MTGGMHARQILAGTVALLAMLGLGYWWGASHSDSPESAPTSAAKAEPEVLYWYDPMVPDQHFDKPGKSPFMDMQLVPRYASGEAGAPGVSIAPGVRQNLGIRTVVAKRARLASSLRVPGTVAWNLREEQVVSAAVDAVVERLYVRTPFEVVRAGQPLLRLRAPAWSAALAESRALRGARSSVGRQLQGLSDDRLRALGLPSGARADANGGIVLVAPGDAVVSEIAVREGQAAPAGTMLLRLNGMRSVWVDAALPQGSSVGIAVGTPVQVTVDAMPTSAFDGAIEALLPQVDAGTRTQRARIVLDNPDGGLRPGMYAQVSLRPKEGAEAVLVPSDAVIADGTQVRVIVLDANDRFMPIEVRTGRSGDGMTEILSGLSGGERVVASGQFLVDSEANLSGALKRLERQAPAPTAQPDASPQPGKRP